MKPQTKVWVITREQGTWDWCYWSVEGVHATKAKAEASLNLLRLTTPEKEGAQYHLEEMVIIP